MKNGLLLEKEAGTVDRSGIGGCWCKADRCIPANVGLWVCGLCGVAQRRRWYCDACLARRAVVYVDGIGARRTVGVARYGVRVPGTGEDGLFWCGVGMRMRG